MKGYKQSQNYKERIIADLNEIKNHGEIDPSDMEKNFMIFSNFTQIFIEIDCFEKIEYLITVFQILGNILAESPIFRLTFTNFFLLIICYQFTLSHNSR